MRQSFEFWGNVQCMFDLQSMQLPVEVSVLAAFEVTDLLGLSVLLTNVCHNSFLCVFLVGSEVDASDACARKSNLSSSWYGGTSVEDWLCFYHSNVTSNLSSSMEVMNAGEGSWPRALSAHRCCWILLWRRRSSLRDPSLRLGASIIIQTWIWWIRRVWSYRDFRFSTASV